MALPADFAIHHEGTMRLLSDVGLHSMNKDAASNFRRASDESKREAHRYCLEPAHVVSEDVALAGSRCVVVDDNIGLCRDGHFCGDAADRVH